MTILQTIAANVAAALATVDTANDAASVVKYNAIIDFAAGVAMQVRRDHINKGSNLETDGKGRVIALLDISKNDRTALVTAFGAAGLKEKDAANIGSMARTVTLHFVKGMIDTGSIRVARSGDEMRAFLAESVLVATGGAETYNAIEKARGRKWEAPADEVEAVEPDSPVSLDDTLEDAPPAPSVDTGEGGDDATVSAEDTLSNEVRAAIRCIDAAVARGDFARLIEQGFRPVIQAALQGIQAHEQAEAQALANEEAQALRDKADKVEKKAA